MDISHGIIIKWNWGVDINVGGPEAYKVSFTCVLKLVVCLIDGCPERAQNPVRLRDHFMHRNWKPQIAILQERMTPILQSNLCGIHILAAMMGHNSHTATWNSATEMQLQRKYVKIVHRVGDMDFIFYGWRGCISLNTRGVPWTIQKTTGRQSNVTSRGCRKSGDSWEICCLEKGRKTRCWKCSIDRWYRRCWF